MLCAENMGCLICLLKVHVRLWEYLVPQCKFTLNYNPSLKWVTPIKGNFKRMNQKWPAWGARLFALDTILEWEWLTYILSNKMSYELYTFSYLGTRYFLQFQFNQNIQTAMESCSLLLCYWFLHQYIPYLVQNFGIFIKDHIKNINDMDVTGT